MENIYSIDQLEQYLSTLAIGTESVQKISEFCRLQENRMDFLRKRANTAAQLLGNDLITECMEDD
jgi:hypothetical protein